MTTILMTDRAGRASSRRGDSQPLPEPRFSKRQTSRLTTSMPKRVTRTRTQTGQGHDSADVDPERGARKNTRRGLRQDSVESNERAKSRDGRRGARKVTIQKGREEPLSTVDEINDTQAQPNPSTIPASTHIVTGSQTKFNTPDGIGWLKSKQAGKGARTRKSAPANPLDMQDIRVDPIPRKLRPTGHGGPSTQVASPRRTQRRSYVPSTAPPRVTNEMVPREALDDEYQSRNRDDDGGFIAERSLTPEDVAERKARQDLSKNKENARQPGQRAQEKARKRFNETQEDRHKVGWDDEEELINDVPATTSRRDLKRKRIAVQEDLQEDDDEADDGDGVYRDEGRDEEDNDDDDDGDGDDVDEDEEDEDGEDAFETNTRTANPSRRRQAPVSPRRAPIPPTQTQLDTQGSPPKRTRLNPVVEASDDIDIEAPEDDVDYPPMERISQQAREKVAAHRENKPQTRKPWTEAESRRLIEFIENDNYKCSWSKIAIADRLLGNRGQVGLKDRARNIKFTYLKAGLALPLNFDLVTLKASEKKILDEMDIAY